MGKKVSKAYDIQINGAVCHRMGQHLKPYLPKTNAAHSIWKIWEWGNSTKIQPLNQSIIPKLLKTHRSGAKDIHGIQSSITIVVNSLSNTKTI